MLGAAGAIDLCAYLMVLRYHDYHNALPSPGHVCWLTIPKMEGYDHPTEGLRPCRRPLAWLAVRMKHVAV